MLEQFLNSFISVAAIIVLIYDWFGKNLKIKTFGALSSVMVCLLWASQEEHFMWWRGILIVASLLWLKDCVGYFNKAWPTKDTLH